MHYRREAAESGKPWAVRPGEDYRSRARKYGVEYVKIDRLEIFERDNWICGICEEPVDQHAPNLRDAASLDHIIPMSRGGDHLPGNVQLAHFGCNCGKRDRMLSD